MNDYMLDWLRQLRRNGATLCIQNVQSTARVDGLVTLEISAVVAQGDPCFGHGDALESLLVAGIMHAPREQGKRIEMRVALHAALVQQILESSIDALVVQVPKTKLPDLDVERQDGKFIITLGTK